MILFFDTETSDMVKFKLPNSHSSQPWIVQIAAILDCKDGPTQKISLLIQSCGLPMAPEAEAVHGISIGVADTLGLLPAKALETFIHLAMHAEEIVAHNYNFDIRLLDILATRLGAAAQTDVGYIKSIPKCCTMLASTDFCQLPGRYGKYKWPKLEELYRILFGEELEDAHDALVDVEATRRCYYELKKRGEI